MLHTCKTFAVSFVATIAIGATMASVASASGEVFNFSVTHPTLDVSGGTQTFEATNGKFTCNSVTGSATISGSSATEVTLVPAYTSCKKEEGTVVHVRMKSCDYLLTSEVTSTHAQMHINCTTAGDEIQINATVLGTEVLCIKIPAQTPTGGGVTYTNVNKGSGTGTVTAKVTITGIEYTEVGACGSGTVANNGTYTAELTLQATDTSGNSKEAWWGKTAEFHSSTAHTTFDASAISIPKFETTPDTIECGKVSVSATTSATTTSEITATPTYEECDGVNTGMIFHVKMRSCDFLLTSKLVGEHSPVQIKCTTEGDEIRVIATFMGTESVCLRIPPQTPTSGGVVYTNKESDISANFTLTGLEYTEVGICDENGGSPNVVNDGSYSGKITLSGTTTEGGAATVRWE